MNQRFLVKLAIAPIATIIPMLLSIPELALAQTTRIVDLQRPRGVTITGQVESIVGNDFILNDGSGKIIVDAGPRWWHSIDLSQGERVTIVGELGSRGDEFDAFTITRADGSVIQIRPAEGPPPWAGGPRRSPKPKK
ncbi:DNA-binding protein [Nostocales cyanobacterium LEGE 11386]|nr:DNA-binding protein [Nostocales cyanobacterium LEGE 11386]